MSGKELPSESLGLAFWTRWRRKQNGKETQKASKVGNEAGVNAPR